MKYKNNLRKERAEVLKLGGYLRNSSCCFLVFVVIMIVTEMYLAPNLKLPLTRKYPVMFTLFIYF